MWIAHLIHNNLLNISPIVYDVNVGDMLGDVKEQEIISPNKVADTIFSLEKNKVHSQFAYKGIDNSRKWIFYLSKFNYAKSNSYHGEIW